MSVRQCPACGGPASECGGVPFLNTYEHCGMSWDDVWCCGCDDECPICGRDITPTSSVEMPLEEQ